MGSTPVFGAIQPFLQAGEGVREAQAQTLNDYVDFLLKQDDEASIVVLGDFNTFQWTDDLSKILPGETRARDARRSGDGRHEAGRGKRKRGAVLFKLVDTLADDNVYSYDFEGESRQFV